MPTIPCANKLNDCLCDASPLRGLSTEAADTPNVLGQGYAYVRPVLGNDGWKRVTCYETDTGPTQAQADLTAYRDAVLCVLGQFTPSGPPTPGPGATFVAFNTAQSCSVNCPDGNAFIFTIPAGVFVASSTFNQAAAQMAADAQGHSYACAQANLRAVCLSPLNPATATQGTAYSGSITATGGALAGPGQVNNWELVSGSLPAGLSFNGGFLASNTVTITGTTLATGTFNFAVSCTDPQGDTMTKNFTLIVNPCTASTAATILVNNGWGGTGPDGGYDTAYSIAPPTNTGPWELQISFNSQPGKTWNWQAKSNANSGGNTVFTINGVQQNFPAGGGTQVLTGSFTPACSAVVVDFKLSTAGLVGGFAEFEWLTPP